MRGRTGGLVWSAGALCNMRGSARDMNNGALEWQGEVHVPAKAGGAA